MRAATTQLRQLLRRPGPALVLGAHDALSAKLAEEIGFDAIWASGFGISAVNAVPDANILTMSEMLETVRRMSDAVRIPVIADCDNGFGNAINVMRTVVEYERAGVAGICIEDNIFPKRCSFYAGVRRELVPVEEHVRKIQAAKEAQRDPDFVVIARTEAFIAGWGTQEALKRASAYAQAGADAILVHSKAPTFAELQDFAAAWDGICPLVAVPTTYTEVTLADLAAVGFKLVIFANQALRAAVKAMRQTLVTLKQEGRPAAVESHIAPLTEVYELVGVADLQANEQKFLLPGGHTVRAIIIAAGFEEALLPLIEDRPKAMLEIKGRTILERQIHALNECGIKDIVVVRGYRKEQITLPNVRYYDNDRFRDTGELVSLFTAEAEMESRFLFLYSDIIFDPAIVEKLLKSQADISIVVDRAWGDHPHSDEEVQARKPDLVQTSQPPQRGYRFLPMSEGALLTRIGRHLPPDQADGEFAGIAMFSEEGARLLRTVYHQSRQR
ncbi:MAG: isocitrate lyase/phosphoenolpyruvate mutase family protein, partial [Candidatus Binatia bacterium]|nr:isocitrate lyase/phosphoenolpyruvate mutase family protein [Candidatus Binatia bacterium]